MPTVSEDQKQEEDAIKTRRKELDRPSQPYTEKQLILQSRFAQNVYNRSYKSATGSLYVLGIVLRIIGTEEQTHEAEVIIDEMLNDCLADMNNEISRFEIVCAENGLGNAELKYTKQHEITARVTSPRGKFFLDMIQQLDRLIELQDALWLGAFISDKQYSANCYMWQRRLIRLGNRIRNMTTKAVSKSREAGEEVAAKVEEAITVSGVDLNDNTEDLEDIGEENLG